MTKLIAIYLLLTGCAHAKPIYQAVGCEGNATLQAQKSAELLKLANEDQLDRETSFEQADWNKINARDLGRRIKVATIFAEGCFKDAADYASAATVYQHGKTADHYFQAHLWARRAVELGDANQMWWTAAALDRYLVAIGHKQLFGTQLSQNDSKLWCLRSVEPSFPEDLRIRYVKFPVAEQTTNTLKAIGAKQSVAEVKDCEPPLKPTPRGTVPGFW